MAAAIPLMIAGGGMSAYGAIQQGKSVSDSLNVQAKNLEAQGAEAEQKGQYDAMRQQMVSSQRIGTIEANYGASGVTATSGSVLDVVQASHANAELDRLNILHGADIRAINYQNQAAMNKYGAANAIKGSYWKAFGSLAGATTSAAVVGMGAKTPPIGTSGDWAGVDASTEGASYA